MKLTLRRVLFAFTALFTLLSFGQTITGKVTDPDGLGLPGVAVVVVGSSTGVQTDFDGNYSITATQGQVIEYSYLGFKTLRRTVTNVTVINVQMQEDAQALDEVVVVGYGTTSREAYTGTVKTVKAENLEIKNTTNVSQALIGEAAGVTVINGSGQPGSVSTIRIRGFGSVNGNRSPLIVLDGVPYAGSLNSINPTDIESTTVLKDATATAIYGARGANGVVLINTKRGTSTGEGIVEVDVKTGVNMQVIPRYNVIRDVDLYANVVYQGLYNSGVIAGNDDAGAIAFANSRFFSSSVVPVGYNLWNVNSAAELFDPVTRTIRPGIGRKYTPELYEDFSFRTGYRLETNVRFSGGDDKSRYFFSAGYLDDQGYAINSFFKRYTTRLNVDSKIKKWLRVSANIDYTFAEQLANGQTAGSENLFEFADKMPPIYGVFLRDLDGNIVEDPFFGGPQYDYGGVSGIPDGVGSPSVRNRTNADNLNPIGSAIFDFNGYERHAANGNFQMDINFTPDLKLELRYGAQFQQQRTKNHDNPFYGTGQPIGGNLTVSNDWTWSQNFLQLLRYNKEFGKHSVEALVAHESTDTKFTESAQSAQTMVNPFVLELNNFVVNTTGLANGNRAGFTLDSYFAQANYNFDRKYFFSASVRRDGSSRFANDKYGTFYSVGGSWVLSNESFLAGNDLFPFLKLKASYGTTGDQDGVGFYAGLVTFGVGNVNDGISLTVNAPGNPDLTWEEAQQFQTGIEAQIGRFLDVNVDYYRKTTTNLIFNRRVGPSQGIALLQVNDGELLNQGIEFDVTAHLIDREDVELDLNINGQSISNEILTMPIEPATGEPRLIDNSVTPFAYSEGRSIFDFYLREWAGVDSATGQGQWYQYYNDIDGDGTFSAGDEAIQNLFEYQSQQAEAGNAVNLQRQTTFTYGNATQLYNDKSAIPDVSGAFRLSGRYKAWDFAAQFTYQFGGWGLDNQYSELMNQRFGITSSNYHSDLLQAWQNPGDITDVPRVTDNSDPNVGSGSTRWLTRTDFLGLNNAKIGYTLPARYLEGSFLKGANFWISGDNLFIMTARNGFNPSTSETGASGRQFYAPLTTLTLGARLKF